jgi:hypothetical protein
MSQADWVTGPARDDEEMEKSDSDQFIHGRPTYVELKRATSRAVRADEIA